MPPLRERREDIPALAKYLVQRCSQRTRRRVDSIDPEAMRLLTSYAWLGNVRELENVLEHALVMGEEPVLRVCDLPETLFETEPAIRDHGPRFYQELNQAKHRIIREALESSGWNYTQAAATLGINRTYLHRLARSLQIHPTTPRP
jgi:transcriptional regulator with PAS, ATPase and Fis domain